MGNITNPKIMSLAGNTLVWVQMSILRERERERDAKPSELGDSCDFRALSEEKKIATGRSIGMSDEYMTLENKYKKNSFFPHFFSSSYFERHPTFAATLPSSYGSLSSGAGEGEEVGSLLYIVFLDEGLGMDLP